MTEAVVNAVVNGVVSVAVNAGVSLITSAVTSGLHDATPEKSQPNALLEVNSQNSAYGLPIPKVFGKAKIAGNIIWQSTGIRYRSLIGVVGETGGKDSEPVYADISRLYLKTLAISLGEIQVKKINRIWADDVLIYDAALNYRNKIGGFTLYDGTQTAADPTIEAYQGAGDVPAYRGQSYVVLLDYPVAKFENKSGIYYPQPTALMTPSFKFDVDCFATSTHRYQSTRESLGYSSTYFKVPAVNAIYEALVRSPFRLSALANDVTTWVDGQTVNTYAGIVTNMQALDTAHPEVITEVIGQSFTNLDIVCSRVFDDGIRPIIGFSNGIHGDERELSWTLEKIVDLLITSNDPVYKYVREHFAVYIVATMNPDGMVANTRNNGHNVNLNRNWPYYWDTVTDIDKGATAASEPETQAVMAWLTLHNPKRIKLWVDLHGQNSRNDFALFTEQLYHDYKVQFTQRACYNYAQSLLRNRVYIPGITFAPTGLGRPVLVESRSRRKPYIYTWIQQQAIGNCYGCILEYPQLESTGLVATAFMDILKGFMAGACDAMQGELSGRASEDDIGGNAILAPYKPLNSNSLFTSWLSSEKRPSFFSTNGLRLSAFLEGTYRTRRFIRSYRPADVGWPVQVAGAGYCVTNDGLSSDQFLICAGYNTIGELPTLSGENLDTGLKTTNQALPTSLRDGAMCYLSGKIYFAGGYDLNLATYSDKIYRASSIPDANGDISGWAQVATIPQAIQRHTITPWGVYLVVCGGRDSVGYLTTVRLYNTLTGVWSVLTNLTTARGWHTAAVYNNTLFIFGGWTGGATLATVEKVNLITGVVTAGTNLPFSRAEQALAVDPNNLNLAYLCCGRTGSTTVQNDIYLYDMAADTVVTKSYVTQQSDSSGTDTIAPDVPDPFVRSAMAFYHPTDDYIGIVGGVDQAGAISFRFYQFDVPNGDMYLRTTDALTWGYLRSTQTFTGAAGDQFSLNIALRNADDPVENPNSNPYARLTVIIGPISSPSRKIRTGYFVPPQDEFRTYTLPFELLAGETEFRIYLRHYGGGTNLDIGAMQVVDAQTRGYIVPQEGGGGGALVETFRTPINSYEFMQLGVWNGTRSASGTFSCIFGSQENVNVKVFEFITKGYSHVGYCEVWFEATQDFSAGVVINPAFPDLVAYPPTGRLYLKYNIVYNNGNTTEIYEVDIFASGIFELNHARLSREWRLDLIDWEIACYGPDCWIHFSYYGYYKKIYLVQLTDLPVFQPGGDKYAAAQPGGKYYNAVQPGNDPQQAHQLAHIFSNLGVNIIGIKCENTGVIMSVSRSLSAVVTKICEDVGLTTADIDTTALNGNLIGYPIGQLISARSMLDPLRAAFAFDVVESGGKLKFKSRSAAVSPIEISESDLVPYEKSVINIGSRQEAEMPRKVSVSYIDPDLTYQQNTQTASRDSSNDIATDSAMSLPLVMSSVTAMTIAETILSASWKGRITYQFKTTFKWIHIEPADIVTLTVNGIAHTVLITGKSISPSGYCEYTADQHSTSAYSSNPTSTPGPLDLQEIPLKKETFWKELDIPIFSEVDNNAGHYVAVWNNPVASGTWSGAAYLSSVDNLVYNTSAIVLTPATKGDCVTILGDAVNVNIFDPKNTVDINVFSGAFITVTHGAVLNGANAIVIGNEVLQFTTSTLVSGTTYRLSGLLRGRLDTPATGHVAGETAILLGDGITRNVGLTSEINKLRYYKALTNGADLAAVTPVSFTNTAKGLKPYAPCHLKGVRNSGSDLTITWVRRTRFNGGWEDNIDIPLNEASESYQLQIMSGVTVKRTVTLSMPNFIYTSTMQIADFGSNQSSVSVKINQISSVVGLGNTLTGAI